MNFVTFLLDVVVRSGFVLVVAVVLVVDDAVDVCGIKNDGIVSTKYLYLNR
jgi:hypothetical protein